MKVIAKTYHGYICEISHSEIEKYMALYYNKMDRLKEGEELDLAKGYDYKSDIVSAVKTLEDLVKNYDKVLKAMASGISFLGRAKDSEE